MGRGRKYAGKIFGFSCGGAGDGIGYVLACYVHQYGTEGPRIGVGGAFVRRTFKGIADRVLGD